MALYRVDVVLPMITGNPRDVMVNTFHFESTATSTTQFAANTEAFLKPFYEAIYDTSATQRVSYIDWPKVKARVFDLADPTPRVPAESNPFFSTAGTGGSSIPTEVACVASFESQGLPGERYQRRYNRVYLGALITSRMSVSSGANFPQFAPTFMTTVADAMKAMQALTDGPGTIWVQASRATGSVRTLPVIGGWVDNSPDTQRRRSVDATARTSWVPDE